MEKKKQGKITPLVSFSLRHHHHIHTTYIYWINDTQSSAFKGSAYGVAFITSAYSEKEPVWLRAVQRHPPGPSLIRASQADTRGAQPFEEAAEESGRGDPALISRQRLDSALSRQRKTKKYTPVRPPVIVYPEDALRRRFYKEHPYELSRPRLLLEWDGHNRRDWTHLCQEGESPTGEHVVQYQLYLMSTGLPEQQAYAEATSEFYAIRAREDTERRLAQLEAQHFGAVPIKSALAIGIEKEEAALANSREVLRVRQEMRIMQNAAAEQPI
ncbi:mitochondrial ribosomal protein S25-domain-containing protein [Syncephalis fuscata]|nr:mitochondrial ribosomal protein S25-domain-containing protein [Syncephalis fuscata]